MKKMTVTMAFLISMIVVLWFFGVTLFQSAQQALFDAGDTQPASVETGAGN
jgi:hypothetical protein